MEDDAELTSCGAFSSCNSKKDQCECSNENGMAEMFLCQFLSLLRALFGL